MDCKCSEIMQTILILYNLSWFSVINICLRIILFFKDLVQIYIISPFLNPYNGGEKSKRTPPADVRTEKSSFFDHGVLLEWRHLYLVILLNWSRCGFWTFWVKNFLLCFIMPSITSSHDKHVHWEDEHIPEQLYVELKWRAGKCWWQGKKACMNTRSTQLHSPGMNSKKPQLLRTAAQNRNLQTQCKFKAVRSVAALLLWLKTNKQNKQTTTLFPTFL